MHHKRFINLLDEQRVISAIQAAEQKTSAQLRVFVSHHPMPEAFSGAQRQFRRLGMAKTKGRNAVLIFIAPKSQTFSIYGDIAIDQKCGPAFWEQLRDELTPYFKSAHYTDAVTHAVTRAGEKLAEYFPSHGPPHNELPDRISHD